MMIALDIKNAFNTLSWDSVINELARRKLPWKIRRLVNNYLTERRVIISNCIIIIVTVIISLVLWNTRFRRVYHRDRFSGHSCGI